MASAIVVEGSALRSQGRQQWPHPRGPVTSRALLNVALVILHADPSRGGAEGYTANLARALHDSGEYRVSLLAESFADGGRLPPVQCVPLPARGFTRARRYAHFLDLVDAELQRGRYDIVHAMLPVRRCDFYHPHAGLAVDAMAHGHDRHANRLRAAMSLLGTRLNARRRAFARVERLLVGAPHGPRVICLTPSMRATAIRCLRCPPERAIDLPYGIDLDHFTPGAPLDERIAVRQSWGVAANAAVALFVGQDFQRKGLAEAITAIADIGNVPATQPHLVVVGRDDAAPYARLARRLGVADHVHFIGSTREPAAAMRSADFLLFPSRSDSCGLVVLESTAVGTPVIVSKQAGASELIQHETHGLIVDVHDRAAIAAAVRQMLDPARRQSMREASLALRAAFAWELHLSRLLGLYRSSGGFQPAAF